MTTPRLTVGDTAPPVELPDTDGSLVLLDPAAHRASVVVFTSNGCPYARAWHDRIQDVARTYAQQGVRVLQVVSNDDGDHPEDSAEGMRKRVAAGELAGPFLRDADQAVAQAYGATATPEVFVIDAAGVVRYHGAPDGDYDDPGQNAAWVREALDDVLAGREVARSLTSPAGCSVKWRVELLWWEGCPTHAEAADLLENTLADLGRGEVHVVRREVRSRAEAERLGFPGSPTFQVGRRDLFPTDAPPALTCRVYQREDGRSSPLPDAGQLAARLRAVARPPLGPAALGRPPQDEARLRRHPVLISTSPDSAGAVMASITFDKITKRYPDGTQAVTDLDLEIQDGEFLVLVGPSGCGKTTALRMAAGLEEISEGRLLIGDRVVNDVHPSQRDIAMVFQNYALYPHMTVRDNIAFPLDVRRGVQGGGEGAGSRRPPSPSG